MGTENEQEQILTAQFENGQEEVISEIEHIESLDRIRPGQILTVEFDDGRPTIYMKVEHAFHVKELDEYYILGYECIPSMGGVTAYGLIEVWEHETKPYCVEGANV